MPPERRRQASQSVFHSREAVDKVAAGRRCRKVLNRLFRVAPQEPLRQIKTTSELIPSLVSISSFSLSLAP